MKTIETIKAVLVTLALALAVACGKTPQPDPNPKPVDPEFTNPVLSIASEGEGLRFSWTASCNVSTVKVDYDLYYAPETVDLFTYGKKVSCASSLSKTISVDELTKVLTEEFECRRGSDVKIKAVVYATSTQNKTSNIENILYHVKDAEIVKPENLYMTGGALDDAWAIRVQLPKTAEGVYEATNVELRFGKAADNKGFKLFVDAESWYPFYGQSLADGSAFGDVAMFSSEADGDSQFYPLNNGYTSGKYTVNVNLNTLKLVLTRTGDIEEFDPDKAIFIVGDGLDKPWELVQGNALSLVSGTLYSIERIHILKDAKFKFSTNGWAKEYVRKEGATSYYTAVEKTGDIGDVRFEVSVNDPAFKSGTYKVTLDTASGVVTVDLVEADVEKKCLYMFGPATVAEWDTSKFIEMPETSEGVYVAEGVEINVGSANPDDPKGNGFKFSASRGWEVQYGAKENFETGYRGWELGEPSNDAFQFYPLLMSMQSGTYTVTVDLNNNTVSLQ